MSIFKTCASCGGTYAGPACPECVSKNAPTRIASAAPLAPGQSFRGLEVLEILGRGGMGVVFKARQTSLDRIVALKTLPPEKARLPEFGERFEREAKALAALSHPNIVTVHEFGREGDLYFFVMEFVEGESLRDRLRAGRLAPVEAVRITTQVCDALEFAHGKGVIHRDVKPENILLDGQGRVRLADFGLAKIVGPHPSDLTQTGLAVGTVSYMAPEQVENSRDVDARADIFCLVWRPDGAVLLSGSQDRTVRIWAVKR